MRWMLLLALVPTIAHADDNTGAADLEKSLTPVAPAKGLDTAPLHAPPWCANVKARSPQWGYEVKAKLVDSWNPNTTNFNKPLFQAAADLCSAPTHPVAQRATQIIEQDWINETGLSDAEAVASLAARIDLDGFEAEVEKLCKSFPEVEANSDAERPAHDMAKVQRYLLGCGGSLPLWMAGNDIGELRELVDRGPVERDVLLRIAWVLYRLHADVDPAGQNNRLAGYAIDQFDIHIPADAVMKRLDEAPFKGNRYGRTIVMESFGRTKLLAARLEAEVAAKTTDPTWKELIVDAPRRGSAAWLADVDKHKDIVARSDAFMRDREAHKSLKGCEAPLHADVESLVKKMKHSDLHVIRDEMSDEPIVGMLLDRLYLCMKSEDEDASNWLGHVAGGIRIIAGPRMAAWFAATDALGAGGQKHKGSHSREESNAGSGPFLPGAFTELSRDMNTGSIDSGPALEGVIQSVAKSGSGVKVVFVPDKARVQDYKCVEGTKIDRVDPDGKVIYRQVCHPTGMITIDSAPKPVIVPTRFAAGVKPGRFMRFHGINKGEGFPSEIYSDRAGTHLVAFYSFSFE
jgi:hypothetical protein